MRAFVFFVFDATSPDISRIVEAAAEKGCICEHVCGSGWESVYVEGPDGDVMQVKLMADHVDSGYL